MNRIQSALALFSLLIAFEHVQSQTLAPLTDAPVTEAPVSDDPVSSSPIPSPTITPTTSSPTISPSSAPITPNPVTNAPSPQPVTPQPVTPQPVTPAPTSAPVAVTLAPVVPTPAPTSEPTFAPTSEPTFEPTFAPTSEPTFEPTFAPTLAPTSAPVTPAPITPEPTAIIPTTAAPTTLQPTLATTSPTDAPSSDPSESPSAIPSFSPSKTRTEKPTTAEETRTSSFEMEMTLTGVKPMDGNEINFWQDKTEEYVVNENGGTLKSADVKFKYQDPPRERRRMQAGGRSLQDEILKVTYTQTLEVVVSQENPPEFDKGFATEPFDSTEDYVASLRTGNEHFQNITTELNVNPAPQLTSAPAPAGGLGTGALIGIIVGGVVGLLVLLLGAYCLCRRRRSRKGYSKNVGDSPPTSIKQSGPDEVSTIGDPVGKSGGMPGGESVADYGDQSLGTVDYDYEGAYGGAANHSVSSAGGTFGSNPQALGANQGAIASGGATLGSFEDDGSFGNTGSPNVREELIDVLAPAGKLGVVIDTPDDGAPVVHAIKDSSVIANKLQVGDKLVAVDDEDVRTMTAIKVSKLISRKSENPTRKLSIIRTTLVE